MKFIKAYWSHKDSQPIAHHNIAVFVHKGTVLFCFTAYPFPKWGYATTK